MSNEEHDGIDQNIQLTEEDDASCKETGDKSATAKASETSIYCPNGGFTAWMRVFGAWLLVLIAWGPALAFGDFASYYASDILSTESTTSIAWIGSLSTTLLVTSGAVSGPLFDRGYVKHLLVLGIILDVVGYICTSFCTELWQFILAQGLCAGVGSGLIYVPALSFVNVSFSTKRPIAVGLTQTGGGFGGVIFPIVFKRLQPQIGFGWTVRTIAFIQIGLAVIGMSILAPAPVKKHKPRNLIDWSAFREPPFLSLCIMFFCHFLSYWIPLFFIPLYATRALGTSPEFASYLLVIANASSIVGRTLPAFVAGKLGPMNLVFVITIFVTIITACWTAVEILEGFIIWSVAWGISCGVFVAVDPVLVTHPIMATMDRFGTRLGMAFVVAGIGVLIGNPIAGVLIDRATASFLNAQIFAAAIMFGALLSAITPLVAIWRYGKREKAEKESDSSNA